MCEIKNRVPLPKSQKSTMLLKVLHRGVRMFQLLEDVLVFFTYNFKSNSVNKPDPPIKK